MGTASRRFPPSTPLCVTMVVSLLFGVCDGGLVYAQNAGSDSVEEILDRAVSAYGATDYPTAEAMLLRVRERSPSHKEIAYWLGCTYRKQKKWDQAIQVFTRMRDLDPVDSRAPGLLGELYMEAGQPAEAVRWYRLAVGLAPADQGLVKRLAEAENAMDGKKPLDALSALEFGLASQTNREVRVWAHIAGAVAFLLVPAMVFHLVLKVYRVPLTQSELRRVPVFMLMSTVACYVAAWGWQPHWRMAVFGFAALLFARCGYGLALRLSVLSIARTIGGVARLAFLSRVLQAMRYSRHDE